MALTNIQAWVLESDFSGSNPPVQDHTAMCVARINSDTGAGTQLILSRTFTSDDGIVIYYDNSADQTAVYWFLDNFVTDFDGAVFASRPTLGVWYMFAFVSSATELTGYFLNLEDPTASVVTAASTTPISGQGATSHMSISSNANGADQTVRFWRVWEGQLTIDELRTEALSTWAVRRTGLKWDVPFDDDDITSPWTDYSGNGYNPTQQAGTAPTTTTNPGGLYDVVHEWGAAEFVVAAAGGTEALTGSAGTSAAGTQTPSHSIPL
jgi:hypothetical protein